MLSMITQMESRMRRGERALLAFAAVLMGVAALLPIWRIEIWAPQYPEGLFMQIGTYNLSGHVDQINILNHYIGMKKIDPAQIPELKIIPWVLGALVISGAGVALWNKRRAGAAWIGAVICSGAVGLFDFFLWGYDYGHNLDPSAPIKIPGLNYQPPLIGHKLLLNIHSYSLPDWGGYLLGVSVLLAVLAVFGRGLRAELSREGGSGAGAAKQVLIACIAALGLASCTAKPQAIVSGDDHCEHCHMVISDSRFAGEVITAKGRVFKFDSISCLLRYFAKEKNNLKQILVADYFKPEVLLEAEKARFLVGSRINGPMGPGPIAAGSDDQLRQLQALKSNGVGTLVDWNGVLLSVK